MKSLVVRLGSIGWLTVGALTAVGACSGGAPPAVERKASAVKATVETAALLATLKARPGSPLGVGVAKSVDVVAGGLKPDFDVAVAEPKPAKVLLPLKATDTLHLEDASSGVAVDVVLRGALPAVGEVTAGYVVYRNALAASGADVLQRPIASATEDYVAFETKPQVA